MAHRTYMYGFDKSKLESLFDSKDKKVIKELQRKIDDDFDKGYGDPEDKKRAFEMIENVVNGSVNPGSLEASSYLFTKLVENYLIFYSQDVVWTNLEHSGFYTYLSEVLFFVEDKDIKNLFEKLYGQAIFNKKGLLAMEFPYTYLSNAEVKKMKKFIDNNKEQFRPFSELGKPFIEGVELILDKKLDLLMTNS